MAPRHGAHRPPGEGVRPWQTPEGTSTPRPGRLGRICATRGRPGARPARTAHPASTCPPFPPLATNEISGRSFVGLRSQDVKRGPVPPPSTGGDVVRFPPPPPPPPPPPFGGGAGSPWFSRRQRIGQVDVALDRGDHDPADFGRVDTDRSARPGRDEKDARLGGARVALLPGPHRTPEHRLAATLRAATLARRSRAPRRGSISTRSRTGPRGRTRAVSASGSPSRARWSIVHASSCSTSPPPASTPPRPSASWRWSARKQRPGPSWSSLTHDAAFASALDADVIKLDRGRRA